MFTLCKRQKARDKRQQKLLLILLILKFTIPKLFNT